MSGPSLWKALLATFPIADTVRADDDLKYRSLSHPLLEIDSIRQKGQRLLQCTWSDENRTSQAAFAIRGKASPSLWAAALHPQEAVKLMKHLNAAIRDYWRGSTFDVHLLLQTSPYQVMLYYPLNPYIVETGQNFEQLTIGSTAVPCQQTDMANSLLPIYPYICLTTVIHNDLVQPRGNSAG